MTKEHSIVRLLSASTKVELALSGSSLEFSQSRLSGVKEGSRQCRRLRQNELNMSCMSRTLAHVSSVSAALNSHMTPQGSSMTHGMAMAPWTAAHLSSCKTWNWGETFLVTRFIINPTSDECRLEWPTCMREITVLGCSYSSWGSDM